MSNNSQCFFVPEITKEEHQALQALHRGDANDHQQQLALYVIVNKFSRAHDTMFIPGESDQTSFLSGRGYVGSRILKYLKLPVGRLPDQKQEDN